MWMHLVHPITPPTSTRDLTFRNPSTNLEEKLEFEEIIHFLRFYNTNSDGSFYLAGVGDRSSARGYGERGTFTPDPQRMYF